MSVEVRAQNTISMTSVKAIKDATDQSAQMLATMEQYAEDAGTTLTGIYQDAEDAKAGAISAKASADTALSNLSQIQSVLEVVEWVALHGEYSKTSDVAINPNKTYYTVTATTITTPTVDDIGTYYELVSGEYVKTTDTAIVVGKTYYTVVGTPVSSPDVADIGTYYELSINEAMANYIQSHLALTNDGLYVMADDSEWKVLISNDGVRILNPSNTPTNQMTSAGNVIGYDDETHVTITSNGLSIKDPYNIEVLQAGTNGTSQNQTIERLIVPDGTLSSEDHFDVSPVPDFTAGDLTISITLHRNMSYYPFTFTVSSLPYTYTFSNSAGTLTVTDNNDGTFAIDLTYSGFGWGIYLLQTDIPYVGESGTLSVGHDNIIEGKQSFAIGCNNHIKSNAEHSTLIGRGLITDVDYQTVIGKYNRWLGLSELNSAFIIGNGTDASTQSNAFLVDWSGNSEQQGHATTADMTAQEVSDFVDSIGGGGMSMAWRTITTTTFSASTQRLDITDYVNNNSELAFIMKWSGTNRCSAPVILPDIFFDVMGDGTMYFETGAYFTSSAKMGNRLGVHKSGTTFKIGVDWCYYEDGLHNCDVAIYGKAK